MSLSHFSAPLWLGFIAVVAALAVGYVLVQRQRRKHMLRFANLELLEKVAPNRPNRWRHAPVALGLAGLLLLAIALAGPTDMKKVPRSRATVVLVIDVSLSMKSTDVKPSRIAAAQQAAKAFVDSLTPGINLGLVTYAGTASVLVSPTINRNEVKTAIEHLQLSERTATGEGIYTALQSIQTLNTVLGGAGTPPAARIVLESDGKQTVPQDLNDPRGAYTAAREAKSKGVSVSTISFGTTWGTVEIPKPEGGTETVNVPVDDPALRQIAKLSDGTFFAARDANQLHKAYDSLQQEIGFEYVRGDSSRPWLILGVLLITAAYVSSLLLRQRLP